MVRVYVRKTNRGQQALSNALYNKNDAITAAFEWRDAHGGAWKKGWAKHVEKKTTVPRGTITRWLQQSPGKFYETLTECLVAVAAVRYGGNKLINPLVDMQLKKALHDHVMDLWRAHWTPPPSYVRAKWLRLQAAAKLPGGIKPFSDEQYKRWKEEWRLTQRIPDSTKARRLEAEKPESITGFHDGVDEKVGDETVHHPGLREVLQWPCDTRHGKSRSFADCLANDEERMGGGDETCLMKAAKELPGVGPVEALSFCRVTDGDREAMTAMIFTGVFGSLYRRFYIKKGTVWTENHLKKVTKKDCRLLLKPESYMMDGGVLVMILEQLAKALGVTPSYRYLLLLDGHGSRLEPEVRTAAHKLGFVIHLFPGSLTHIMQVRLHTLAHTRAHTLS